MAVNGESGGTRDSGAEVTASQGDPAQGDPTRTPPGLSDDTDGTPAVPPPEAAASEAAGGTETRAVATPLATVRAAGGVVRVAAYALSGTARWSAHTALDVTETVVRRSLDGVPPQEIRAEAALQLRDALRRVLGVQPIADTDSSTDRSLREQGEALLKLAASPRVHDEGRPAFARILAELTSDEARILRLLRIDGPQPAVTVRGRASRGVPREATDLGITMISDNAGLRHPDRTQHYLTNLRRLGLIEAMRDPIGSPHRYQLLEAQAAVRDLLKQVGSRGKLQHRGIALTDFGADFVGAVLPLSGEEGPTIH